VRGKTFFGGQNLLAGFAADDHLKIADHSGIGMRSEDRAKKIVGGANVGDPIAHGFVDGILQRAAAAELTPTTCVPSRRIRATLSAWRAMSSVPM